MKADFEPEKVSVLRGLVIWTDQTRGANRRVRLLTAERGCLPVTAYGSGKAVSPLAGATQLFTYGEYTLLQKRSAIRMEDALCIESFAPLRDDMQSFALACYFAELLASAVTAEQESAAALQLTLCAFSALASGKRQPALVKAAYELRLLSDAGFAPALECCGGVPDRFYPETGDVRCEDCADRPLRYDRQAIPITIGTLQAMRHVREAAYRRVFAFSLGDESLAAMSAACEAFASSQVARTGPALEFYKKLTASADRQ